MTRVAAIDCGTNSVRLLVAESSGDGFVDLDRQLRLTRLGQGVDATGEFHPDALARTFAACDEYAAVLAAHGVDRVRFVATSAARDAGNREAFFAGVRDRIGVDPEVISGDEEAQLSFDGALAAAPDAEPPALVMDVGGGSTELVLGTPADPPTVDEVAEASEFVDDLLDASGVDFGAARTWLGVGGTATSLSAIAQGLAAYDRATVHGSVVSRDDVAALASRLLALDTPQRLEIPTMVPGRADVICAGALIVARVGARLGPALTVSEADILDGIVARLLADESVRAS